MPACIICRFDVELDDIAVRGSRAQRVVCLRCFQRETGAHRHMSRRLRRDVQAALAGL